jgi:hypothetical protein
MVTPRGMFLRFRQPVDCRAAASITDGLDGPGGACVTTARTASRARNKRKGGGKKYRRATVPRVVDPVVGRVASYILLRKSGGPRDLVPPASQGCEANQPMGSRRPAGSLFLYFSLHAFPIQFNSIPRTLASAPAPSVSLPLASLKNSSSDVTATGS